MPTQAVTSPAVAPVSPGPSAALVRSVYRLEQEHDDLKARRRCLAAFLEIVDQNVKVDLRDSLPGLQLEGRHAVARFFALWRQTWESYQAVIHHLVEVAPERIVAAGRVRAIGHAGRAEASFAHLWILRRNKVLSISAYPTVERAELAAQQAGEL